MTESKIISNNGDVARLSDGKVYARSILNPSIGKAASLQAFAVDSTEAQALERLKQPLSKSTDDGIPLGTVLPSPVRPNVGNLGYNYGENKAQADAAKQEHEDK
jgi:hypothetical protein